MTEHSCENPEEHCDLHVCQLTANERHPDIEKCSRTHAMPVPTVAQRFTTPKMSVVPRSFKKRFRQINKPSKSS